MRSRTTKQIERMEKKKKKLAALIEIAKLNDKDRAIKAAFHHHERKPEPMDVEDGVSDPSPESPRRKRQKKNNLQHDVLTENTTHGDKQLVACEEAKSPEKCMEVKGVDAAEHNTNLECGLLSSNKRSTIGDVHSMKSKRKKVMEEYTELKNELKERRNSSRNVPSFRLKTVGEMASLSMKEEARIPLLLSDIQHALMYALLGQRAPFWPLRWCAVEKYNRLTHILVFVVEGMSVYDFTSRSSSFQFINNNFEHQVEIIMPTSYNGNLVQELVSVPLTEVCKEKLVQQYGSLEAATKSKEDVYKVLKAFFTIESSEEQEENDLPTTDRFSRTKLLLSVSQLMGQNYPLPVKGNMKNRYAGFICTKNLYKDVSAVSPMYGLDCEMCRTTTGELEVTRISMVNEKLDVVYETFVKPYNPITDYLTQYSGITKQSLLDVTVRLEDVQNSLRTILPPDAILIGQSLNADLQSLKMMHPFVIDTSVIYNITGERHRKSKLSMLSHKFLKEDIQTDCSGHSPVEDSIACMKLTQLKLANGIDYGDAVLLGRKEAEKKREIKVASGQLEYKEDYASSMFSHAQRQKKEVAVVTVPEKISDYNKCISQAETPESSSTSSVKTRFKCIEEASNAAVVERTCEIVLEHHFTLAHITCGDAGEESTVTAAQLDEMCEKLWQHTAFHGMCMVLLGGKGGANGASFVGVKKKHLYPGPKL